MNNITTTENNKLKQLCRILLYDKHLSNLVIHCEYNFLIICFLPNDDPVYSVETIVFSYKGQSFNAFDIDERS